MARQLRPGNSLGKIRRLADTSPPGERFKEECDPFAVQGVPRAPQPKGDAMAGLFSEWRVEVTEASGGDGYEVALYDDPPKWRRRCEQSVRPAAGTVRRIESVRRRIGALELGIDLEWLGLALADVLLPGAVGRDLADALSDVAADNGVLRLRVDVRAPGFRAWPWEYVRLGPDADGRGGEFLGTSPFVSIVRQSEAAPADLSPRHGRPVRALIVWADPKSADLTPAGGLLEVRSADQALQRALAQDVDIAFLGGQRHAPPAARATRANIARTLKDQRPDAVLFVCHGAKGGVAIEAEGGDGYEVVTPADLADLLGGAGVQVAMFDACTTGGVAAATARAVPIVVAMQFRVTVATAETFWRSFFHVLAEPMPVDLCVGHGRRCIENAGALLPDWGAPVLYRGQVAEPARRGEPRIRGAADGLVDVIAGSGAQTAVGEVAWPGEFAQVAAPPAPAAAAEYTPEVIRLLRGADPWHLLLLGEDSDAGAARWTQPIWCTGLRHAPALLVWPPRAEAARYLVEVSGGVPGGPMHVESDRNLLAWDRLNSIGPGTPVVWRVTGRTGDGREVPCVQAMFWILDAAEQNQLDEAEQRIKAEPDDAVRAVALADARARSGLYDDAIRTLHALAWRLGNGLGGFVVRRALGSVFQRMHNRMNYEASWSGPELAWAGAANDRQMRLAWCAALGRLGVYRSGGCDACRRCGLV